MPNVTQNLPTVNYFTPVEYTAEPTLLCNMDLVHSGTDPIVYENRAHVHVGKRSTEHLCKIWLEPVVELEDKGDMTDAQVKEVLKIATDYREKLLHQWEQFKQGKPIRIIKIKKTK